MTTLLSVQSSGRDSGSVTRQLSADLIEQLGPDQVLERDLAEGIPFVDDEWIAANFTPPEKRTQAQHDALSRSDALIQELRHADTLVIGAPVYNFTVPAALKAWIDQICRAGVTFRYTETGPVGLLENKTAYIVLASGGTEAGSEGDYLTPYLKHVLCFVGINDVRVIAADELMKDADRAMAKAKTAIEAAA